MNRKYLSFTIFIIVILSSFWSIRPLDDLDLYTQLVLGRYLPNTPELLTFTPNQNIYVGWLAQICFSTAERYFGLLGVKLLNVLLLAGAFYFLSICLFEDTRKNNINSIIPYIFGLISAFLVSASNTSARPQTFSYLFFCLLLYLIKSGDRSLLKYFTLCLLWQNSHPSLPLGLLVILICSISLDFKLAKILFICSPAILLTPDGFNIFNISKYSAFISREYLTLSEWQPPWTSSVIQAMTGFWVIFILIIISVISLIYKKKFSVFAQERYLIILNLTFLILTLYSARFAPYWGFVAAPLITEIAHVCFRDKFAYFKISTFDPKLMFISIAIFVASQVFYPAPLLPNDVPWDAFRKLKNEHPNSRIFNYHAWGGPLEWVGYPGWNINIDGRLYLYSVNDINHYYQQSMNTSGKDYDNLISSFDIFALNNQFQRTLISVIEEHCKNCLYAEGNNFKIFINHKPIL